MGGMIKNIFRNRIYLAIIFSCFVLIPLKTLQSQNFENFGFYGYLRSGFGLDSKGKAMAPFQAPNAEAKYRLGNEAETYLEAAFAYFKKNESGATFNTRILIAMVTPMSGNNGFVTSTSLREAYVIARGVWESFPEAGFWAGQRYYDRHDMHLNDFWYRDMSGFGGGIEDFKIGKIKTALAYLGGSIDQLSPSGSAYNPDVFVINKSSLDFRIYNIELFSSELAFTATYSYLDGDSINTDQGVITVTDSDGWSLGMFYIIPINKNESRNKTNIFYGNGAAENYRSVLTTPLGVSVEPGNVYHPDNIKRFRVINDLLVNFSHKFSLQNAIIYQLLDNGLTSNNLYTWFSFGLRPIWHFNKYFSLAMELGWDYTKQEGGDSGSLFKITLAPQISPNNTAMSRPALRVFVTYAFWSDTFVGQVSPLSYGSQQDGLTIGIQAETWW